ncbi:MAG: nuclease-related domain-containing protein [bacterium]
MGTVVKSEQTLEHQQDRLSLETSILSILLYVEFGAGVLFGAYGLHQYTTEGELLWVIVAGLLMFFSGSHYLKTVKNRSALGNIWAGRSGEDFVSRLLEEELPNDCYILNDVTIQAGTKSAQIDHVIVSSGGVHLVETKAYRGHLRGSAESDYLTLSKPDGDETQVTNPISQSRRHAGIFKQFLDRRPLEFDQQNIEWSAALVDNDCSWQINGNDHRLDYARKIPERIQVQQRGTKHGNDAVRKLLLQLGADVPTELREATN